METKDTEVSISSRMPVYFHRLYTDGIHVDARFPRDRYRRLSRRLNAGLASTLIRVETAPRATRQELLLAHDADYVDRFLAGDLHAKEIRRIGLRPWTPLLVPRTLHIVGGALAALRDALVTGGLSGNMAGGTHHAHRDFGSGYCVFNDLAVCARYATRFYGLSRVLILDLDVHQGDGTATIFGDDPNAMTVSVHCGANFPFRKAMSDHDFTLEPGAEDHDYLAATASALEVGARFNPQLILYQAGVDGLASDALGRLNVSRLGMQRRNRLVFDACRSLGVPCVVFMGGGYSDPIEPTVDAFEDLFLDAASSHERRMRTGSKAERPMGAVTRTDTR